VLILAARSLQLVSGTRDEVTLSFIICTTLLWLLEYTLHSLEHNGSNIASESIMSIFFLQTLRIQKGKECYHELSNVQTCKF
jgi:hypothetical protein